MKLTKHFFKPIDNAQLILFRIIYGSLITIEAWGAIATGWVRRTLIEPQFTFNFIDFPFLQPLEGNGMIYYFLLMGCFGLMVSLGFRFRLAIISYSIMWAGVYFMQKTSYNNHYYLMLLFNFIFCFLPASRYKSIDVKLKPSFQRLYCPSWCVWLFKALILIVYFYSAVAKMYPAWINAVPIKLWFSHKADYCLVGPLLTKEWFQYLVAWGGIAFDLLIVPALLWKKTRKAAFIVSIFFHLFNSFIFQVGVFPYLGISFALFFFYPDQIRKWFFPSKAKFNAEEALPTRGHKLVPIVVSLFLVWQLLLPLRHHLFEGNVNWTEEGHRMSWRMMLRSKSGYIDLVVVDNNNSSREQLNLMNYLSEKQISKIAIRPDLLWQFVQRLKGEYAKQGKKDISIYAQSQVSLNGAPYKPLYDPDYDLAQAEWSAWETSEWVLKRE